jgi:hypothetical protein
MARLIRRDNDSNDLTQQSVTAQTEKALLVVIAVTAAASGLLVIGQPGNRRRAAPATARPDAVAGDPAAAGAAE